MNRIGGLDAWLTREQPGTIFDPHAPWDVCFVSRDGDYYGPEPTEREIAAGGTWGVERPCDDGGSWFAMPSRADALVSVARLNARRRVCSVGADGVCVICGDIPLGAGPGERISWVRETAAACDVASRRTVSVDLDSYRMVVEVDDSVFG